MFLNFQCISDKFAALLNPCAFNGPVLLLFPVVLLLLVSRHTCSALYNFVSMQSAQNYPVYEALPRSREFAANISTEVVQEWTLLTRNGWCEQ
jgi:hypothetical protein